MPRLREGVPLRRDLRFATALAAVVLLTTALAVVGASPWPLWIMPTVLVAFATYQRSNIYVAASAGVVVTLTAASLLARLAAVSGLPFVTTAVASALLVDAIALGVLIRLGPLRVPRVTARTALMVLALLALPVATAVTLAVTALRGSLGYSWAMHNDAVWNVVTARFILDDRGIAPWLHDSSAPLTPLLLALGMAPGRDDIAPAQLLMHDIARSAELWVLLALGCSLLAGVIAARTVPATAPLLRAAAVLVAGLIPMAWFTFGYALEFGFYNATLSALLLLATWLAWLEHDRHPLLATPLLALASVALLSTWAPLVAVSGLLLVFAAARAIRGARTRIPLLVAISSLAVVAGSFAAFTLPALLAQSGALSANGGIFQATPLNLGGILLAALAVIVAAAVRRRDLVAVLGASAVVLSGGVGIAYLLYQRSGEDELWGYYPVKFGWLVLTFIAVPAVAAAFSLAATFRRRAVSSLVLVLALLMLAGSLWQLGPRYAPRTANLLPLTAIANGTGMAHLNPASERVLGVAVDGDQRIAFRLWGAEYDRFANMWLLQLEARSGDDPLRAWAYGLNPESDSDLCSALSESPRSVTVLTADTGLAERLAEHCPVPTADYSIEVVTDR